MEKQVNLGERRRKWLGGVLGVVYIFLLALNLAWPAGLGVFLAGSAIAAIFGASQLFWYYRLRAWSARLIPSERWRRGLGIAAVLAYAFFLAFFLFTFASMRHSYEPTHLTARAALAEAAFPMWLVCSVLGFFIAILFAVADRAARAGHWLYGKLFVPANPGRRSLISPDRRHFLEQTVYTLSAAPFVAGTYGLFYGRLNLETTHPRIKLRRLPNAFHGFRIAHLSDIHIGAFMPEEEIRRYVAITNATKPDLIAVTGDFITWDPFTQGAVVDALRGLSAPFGVFGCLGNHEAWYHVEGSITRLFAAAGIKILRGTRVAISASGETLNLIGVDFQTRTRMGPPSAGIVRQYLQGVEPLVMPETANILLSHNPNTFDRAAELGIDLSLAGHTHGGQVTLEFISPYLSPGRLITRYVRGWFEKGDAQLYVNRGIGTIFVPMRLGAPPELTVYELVRA
jgi:hypothetical protein